MDGAVTEMWALQLINYTVTWRVRSADTAHEFAENKRGKVIELYEYVMNLK